MGELVVHVTLTCQGCEHPASKHLLVPGAPSAAGPYRCTVCGCEIDRDAPLYGLAPQCARCGRRHLVDLPCWSGRYAQRVTGHVLRVQGTVCWLCGNQLVHRPADSADHVIPRSRGGTDAMDNLRPAHHRCNARRRAGEPFPTPPALPASSGPPRSTRWRTTP